MKDIATVMAVAGEDAYFEFARYSIPSFLRNNKSVDLFVFTDDRPRIEQLQGLHTGRLRIVSLNGCFKMWSWMVKRLEQAGLSDEEMIARTEKYGFLHHHVFVSALLPIAEYYLHGLGDYTHILKVDCDAYFAGGDMMTSVREDVHKAEGYDLFLVKRKHPLMESYGGGKPGVGFTLWKMGSNFIPEYVKRFQTTEQVTILQLYGKNIVKTKILSRPGYHFVRPFWKSANLTKNMLEEFLPAYFHLHGIHAKENLKKLEDWFGNA